MGAWVCACVMSVHVCVYVWEHGAGGRQSNRKERFQIEFHFTLKFSKYIIQAKSYSNTNNMNEGENVNTTYGIGAD